MMADTSIIGGSGDGITGDEESGGGGVEGK